MKSCYTVGTGAKILLAGLTIAALVTFGFYAHALLLKYPPVWPDESLFADPVIGLLRRGVMGTPLLSQLLPGIDQRTYWMPPLYYGYLWAVFSIWGPGIVPLRLSSVGAALAVLGLTYLVGVRSGLGRWLALIPVSLLAIDALFLRAALIGRMDMLALAFILASLWLALGRASSMEPATPGRSFVTGLASAAAFLTHPMGAVAPAAVLVARSRLVREPLHLKLVPLLAGIVLPLLGWGIYILQDPRSFVAQFGGQIFRKVSRSAFGVDSLPGYFSSGQYGISSEWEAVVWVGGLLGLYFAVTGRKDLPVLAACQLLALGLALWSREMWYPIYLLPLTAIGLGYLVGMAREGTKLRVGASLLAIVLCVCFARYNLNRIREINIVQNELFGDVTDYNAWCKRVSNLLPRGSRVLLSVIPDPYLGLGDRTDLTLHEFLPEGLPANQEQYRHLMEEVDFIVVGRYSVSNQVGAFVKARGRLVGETAPLTTPGYYAGIYRIVR